MSRKTFLKDHMLMKKVAYLASTNLQNNLIADRLAISASTTTRLLVEARQHNYLAKAPALLIDRAETQEIHDELFGDKKFLKLLKDEFKGGQLSDLLIVDNERNKDDSYDWVARHLLSEVFPHVSSIGLAWGYSIRKIVRAIYDQMEQNYISKNRFRDLEIVQTCGDSRTAIKEPEMRSSSLVVLLNAALTNSIQGRHTFTVSASIPKIFDQGQLATIQQYISTTGGYADIFKPFPDKKPEGKPRLKIALDSLVTSCGSGQPNNDSWIKDCAIEQKIPPKQLAALVAGNIGGIWLPKDNLKKAELTFLQEINNRWTGMNIADIRRINKNSRQGGVICIALENHKLEAVLELLKKDLVRQLIIDKKLMENLITAIS